MKNSNGVNKLDNKKLVEKLDPDRALESVDLLGEQISQVVKEFKKVRIPESYKKVKKILINGMGGSQLAPHILQSVFLDEIKVPVQIINSYKLPAYLDKDTLYIISSYSGDTEEPVSTFAAAKKTGAKIFGITSGGKLRKLINQGKIPGYVFDPVANPSAQPRIGLGYSLAAHILLFKGLGLIKISDKEIKGIINLSDKLVKKFGFNNPASKNLAKKMAVKVQGNALALIAAEHLAGNAHVFANQTNETGKTFSAYYLVSEMNHHLLEGLKNPASNRSSLLFIFFESKLYHPKNQLRFKITQTVVSKNKVKFIKYQLTTKDKLSQAIELLSLGSYITFYLAMLNNINPNLIPWVDYFKAQLEEVS